MSNRIPDKHPRTGAMSMSLLALATATLFAGQTQAAPLYAVTSLATLAEGTTMVIRGPNVAGVAAGGGKTVNGRMITPRRGLLMDKGEVQPITGLQGSDFTTVHAVNDAGGYVGSANTGTGLRAFRGTRNGASGALPLVAGDTANSAYGVNNRGQAVGFSSGPSGERAVLWRTNNAVSVLPGISAQASRAYGINDRGDVVGMASSPSGTQAVKWPAGGFAQVLVGLAGYENSEAMNLNARGDAVGFSSNGEGVRRATLWPAAGGAVNLGTLPGGSSSQAFGTNDAGNIVGSSSLGHGNRAVIWEQGGTPVDLNTMIEAPGLVLTKALGINNNGMILAIARAVEVGHENHDHGEHHDHEAPVHVVLLTRTVGANK